MGNKGIPWKPEQRRKLVERFGTLRERFHSRYEFDPFGGCWLWTGGYFNKTGYGAISINHRSTGAHRVSYELHHGPIPRGMQVCHRCDVRACVNPAHLFLGSPADNVQDMYAKGRACARRGDHHPDAKIRAADLPEIRRRLADGESCRTIAADYGVTDGAINAIRRGRSWRGVGVFNDPEQVAA